MKEAPRQAHAQPGALRIALLVLRGSTEGTSHGRDSIGEALWHGLCAMGIVLVRSSDSKSVRPSRLHVNGGRRTVCRVLSNAAHQSIPSRRTRVVSPKLSRSDLVQGDVCHPDGPGRGGTVDGLALTPAGVVVHAAPPVGVPH